MWAGLAADPDAGQEFLDTFARRHRPDAVLSRARRARWRAAWAYEKGLDELLPLLGGLDDDALRLTVPACPAWTVGDLLAHLAGVAEDTVRGDYFAGAMTAWRDPTVAAERDAWTDGHLHRFADRGRHALLGALREHGCRTVQALRSGAEPLGSAPSWMVSAPAADLAVHLADLREALGLPADAGGTVARFGFGAYRGWLHHRLVALGGARPPALPRRGRVGRRERQPGRVRDGAAVRAVPHHHRSPQRGRDPGPGVDDRPLALA